MEAKGKTGYVRFDGEFVTITREGFIARRYGPGEGQRRRHVSDIDEVLWKPATFLDRNGYIRFFFKDAPRGEFVSPPYIADENVVFFPRRHAAEFEAIHTAITARLTPHTGSAPTG